MVRPFELKFSNKRAAWAIRVHHPSELRVAIGELGLATPSPTLVLVGGASGISDADMDLLRPLFAQVLVPLADNLGASVVDGGTNAGIMQLIGMACSQANAVVPLIGVAATGTVALPTSCSSLSDAAPLEPRHTHFVLVPGSKWGDESPWLIWVADALAQGAPSATVLVNGGETSWDDVTHSVRAGRPVIAVAGSGRTADALTAALRGDATDERAIRISASGLVHAVDLSLAHDMLPLAVRKLFSYER